MPRTVVSVFLSASIILGVAFALQSTVAKPPAPAHASVREGKSDRLEEFAGRVTAVRGTTPFDPFGEIVPLPVVRFDHFVRPAFDPTLYRGGRASDPLRMDELCDVLAEVAEEFDLPPPLFTRLIWQESRFRNEIVSHAGAQGMAQFMPRTAELRGLEDPFDPLQALPASADFLRELVDRFGNFGLAAAAYNGGPTRVRAWLAGQARLPKETRKYVLSITGRTAEYWRREGAKAHPRALNVNECRVTPIRAAASD